MRTRNDRPPTIGAVYRHTVLAAGLALVFATNPAVADGDAVQGQAFALKTCSQCHVVTKTQPTRRPQIPGAPSFYKLAEDPEVTPFYLRAFFRTPHRRMPDIILKPNDRDDVIAYIMSLRAKK